MIAPANVATKIDALATRVRAWRGGAGSLIAGRRRSRRYRVGAASDAVGLEDVGQRDDAEQHAHVRATHDREDGVTRRAHAGQRQAQAVDRRARAARILVGRGRRRCVEQLPQRR